MGKKFFILLACLCTALSWAPLSAETEKSPAVTETQDSQEEKQAEAPPAPPKWLAATFGETLLLAQRTQVSSARLQRAIIGVYFSAHWCGPCRNFTPKLIQFRNGLRRQGFPFEVVFVSCDRTEKEMFEYMTSAGMPWVAVPFASAQNRALKERYQVSGIPRLVILAPDGAILAEDGRGDVEQLGFAAFKLWERRLRR